MQVFGIYRGVEYFINDKGAGRSTAHVDHFCRYFTLEEIERISDNTTPLEERRQIMHLGIDRMKARCRVYQGEYLRDPYK